MKKCFTHGGALAVLAILVLCGVVPDAAAQAPPPLCDPGPGEFDKTWTLIDDPDMTGTVTPGDAIEFEVLLCNSSGAACFVTIRDGLDDLLTDNTRWDREDLPSTSGCPTDGGATCEYGPRGGPYAPAPTIACGEECTGTPDNMVFRTAPTDPSGFLPDGQCARMVFRARISAAITTSECLCNVGNQLVDIMLGFEEQTHDPNWVSLEDPAPPVAPGCLDTETCPAIGTQCNSCVRVNADVELGGSTKCIDMSSPACGDLVTKNGGDSIRYEFTIQNDGAVVADNVVVTDDLSFLSDLATPCLDTPTFAVTDPVCSWATPCPPGPPPYTTDYTDPLLRASMPSIPPGENVTFSLTGDVAAGVAGNCTNNWQLQYTTLPLLVPVTPRTFTTDATASLVNSTKCIDEGATCETAVTRNPLDTVDYVVTFVNDGTLQADDVQVSDNLMNLGCTGGVVGTTPATCTLTGCDPAATCTVTSEPITGLLLATISSMSPGCEAEFTFTATVTPGTSGDCCNVASADWTGPIAGSFTTPDACFTDSGLDVSVDKTVTPASGAPGDMATFQIVIVNNDVANPVTFDLEDVFDVDGCFLPLADCSGVVCMPGSVCGLGPCGITPGGFTWQGISLTANGGGDDTVTFDFTLVTDSSTPEADCTNAAQLAGSICDTGNPLATCHATFDFGAVVPTFTKGASGIAPPSSTGTYEVTIDNPTGADLTNCVLRDDLTGNTCATLNDLTCAFLLSPANFAFCATGLVQTDPFTVAAGTTEVISFDVTTGASEVDCANTASLVCDGFTPPDATGDLVISSGAQCDLLELDATHAPVSPTLASVFVASCAVGSTPRLDPADAAVSAVLSPALTGDIFGSTAVVNGELQMYQLDCPCSDGIYLTPLATNDIEITFF